MLECTVCSCSCSRGNQKALCMHKTWHSPSLETGTIAQAMTRSTSQQPICALSLPTRWSCGYPCSVYLPKFEICLGMSENSNTVSLLTGNYQKCTWNAHRSPVANKAAIAPISILWVPVKINQWQFTCTQAKRTLVLASSMVTTIPHGWRHVCFSWFGPVCLRLLLTGSFSCSSVVFSQSQEISSVVS